MTKLDGAAEDAARVPAWGQLLTAPQHKAHMEAHLERCRAAAAAATAQPLAQQLKAHTAAHGFKLAERSSTDVLGDGRVLKTTLAAGGGDEWERPWELAKAQLHYPLWLEPAAAAPSVQLQSSGGETPLDILIDEPTADASHPLPEVEAAVRTMRRGEHARISIRPDAPLPPNSHGRKPGFDTVGLPAGQEHAGCSLVAEVRLVGFENPSSVMMMGATEELAVAAEVMPSLLPLPCRPPLRVGAACAGQGARECAVQSGRLPPRDAPLQARARGAGVRPEA